MISSKGKIYNSLAACENVSTKRMSFKDSVCRLVLLFLNKNDKRSNGLDLTPPICCEISNVASLDNIKRKLSWEFEKT